MNKRYAFLLPALFAAFTSTAQYCSPTFPNGCFSWTNLSISLGTLNWNNTDCNISDYTGLSTTITAGVPSPMTVVNGTWTGCAVWVDLNNDYTFQDSENLHYEYVGGSPSYTYNFDITVPANTPTGAYRMRVIAPWGSDGFLNTNTNGYGPCGAYQYGNFNDFTLNVSGSTAIAEPNIGAMAPVLLSANPTNGLVVLQANAAAPLQRVIVRSVDGRVVQDRVYTTNMGRVQLDLSAVADGAYVLQCTSGAGISSLRVVKE